jgi:hypothetical protein
MAATRREAIVVKSATLDAVCKLVPPVPLRSMPSKVRVKMKRMKRVGKQSLKAHRRVENGLVKLFGRCFRTFIKTASFISRRDGLGGTRGSFTK